MQRSVIVIPCYNEAGRLHAGELLEASQSHSSLSFVLVDDGSRDDTFRLLTELAAQRPRQFEVVRLPSNRGKAEAVRQGMLAAFERSPSLLGYFDADLATPLSEIGPMVALFERPEVHLVMGSRVQLLGRKVHRSPLRHYLGRVYASTASIVLGLDVYDTQCGAKLFRNTKAVRNVFAEPFASNWSFDVEIIARFVELSRKGELPAPERAALEYPLREWQDIAGSKLSPQSALGAAIELARIWHRYRPGRRD